MAATIKHEFDTKIFEFSKNIEYKSVVERYYVPHYKIDVKMQKGEDMCVLSHSNRLCIITIAPSHPLLLNKKTVTKVDFQVKPGTNLLDNAPKGKYKRGGQGMHDTSRLCTVTCSDETEYIMHTCIRGKLIEVNDSLVENPNWLTEKHNSDGFIAIISPKPRFFKQEMETLLTKEQYQEALERRENELAQVVMEGKTEETAQEQMQ
ncbi:protein Abitram-like [Lineus longissimus]|uniref:protein Abitram-like n=1 Tax=Lineus longissimus TaxID=88925 RepID=UPI002B4C2AE1